MDLVEGRVRYRKGKKWKTRWAVLRRVNPATEVLNLVLYPKDMNAGARHKEKSLLSLRGFSGLQVLNKMDKHFNIIVIITTDDVIPLSFETIDQRTDWLAQLQGHYGKEKSFEGIVPHKQKIKSGEAVLRFYSTFFSLTKKDSCRLIGHWKLTSLPKYGAVDGGFAFQASPESPTGDKPVIYFFATRSGREIHALFDSVCRAGEGLPRQYSQSEATQPGPSEDDTRAQPNFFKRAWRRMSGKRPRKGKAERPRSQSMPSKTRGRKQVENTEQVSPQVLQDDPPRVRRNESVPASLGASGNDDVFEQEQPKGPTPGYENIAGVTPEGYTVMIPDDAQVRQGRSSSAAYSPTRNGPERRGIGTVGNDKVDAEKEGDAEGYIVVEGRDEELLEKIIADSQSKEMGGKEGSQRQVSRESQNERINSSSSTKEKRVQNGAILEEDETEKQEVKLSENERQSLTNGDVQCQVVVTPSGVSDQNTNNRKEVIVNGHQELNNLGKNDSEVKKNGAKPTETAASNADYVNGDIIQHRSNVKAMEKHVDSTGTSVSTRRGLKNPPILNLPPTSTVGSAEHLYVNSPKIVDYVNVQGGRSGALRSRSKTSSQSGGKSKLTPYAMYDGNDDSIYHSVESLMPSHPGYLNVLGDDPSRSHSFENIAGHSYANVGGAQPSYQNIGHDRSYVNVMSRPYQGNLNYVRVEGVDSSHATSPLPITTSPKSSDYTWIDERKTKLLQDTAKLHSERRQENLPRVMKK